MPYITLEILLPCQDPLAIPYALAVERFCPRESSADDNPENFEVA